MNKKYGDGTLYFDHNKNKWIVQICNNASKRTSKSFALKREAQQYLKDEKYKDNPELQRKIKTLQNIMYENLELKYKTNQIGKEQFERINRTIKTINKSYIATLPIKEITSQIIQDYYSTIIDNSQSTINKIHEQFYQVFNYSIIRGYIDINPMNNVKRAVSTW